MFCRLFLDPPASGAWNMAVDEALLESAAADEGFSLRFYRWIEPTLSLGYFQKFDDRNDHAASRNCAIVRRATGGGAILHDSEVTYSITVPPGNRLASQHLILYKSVHAALIEVLAGFGFHAAIYVAENRNENANEPFLCFQRRSPGDVLLSDLKIAGSAQRRFKGAVLQHGSVLLRRSDMAPELPGIFDLVKEVFNIDQLIREWSIKLADAMSLKVHESDLSDLERKRARELEIEKYCSDGWTKYRGREKTNERWIKAIATPSS
jgi:lipoate-protein ligase A